MAGGSAAGGSIDGAAAATKRAEMSQLRCAAVFAVECSTNLRRRVQVSRVTRTGSAARAGQWSQPASGQMRCAPTAISTRVAACRSRPLLPLHHCHARHSDRRARPSGVECGFEDTRVDLWRQRAGSQTDRQRDESRPTGGPLGPPTSTNSPQHTATTAQLMSSCNSHHAEISVVSMLGGDDSPSTRMVVALESHQAHHF